MALVGTGETSYSAETGKIYTYTTDKTYMFYGQGEDITESLKGILAEIMYPVGSIYISTTEQNPGEYFGGTWESYGQGRTIIGAGEGTDSNGTSQTFTAESTGGEYTHTLTVAETPAHTHTRGTMEITGTLDAGTDTHSDWFIGHKASGGFSLGTSTTRMTDSDYGTTTGYRYLYFKASNSWTGATSSVGGSQSHNNIQPYITCYIWKRVQ